MMNPFYMESASEEGITVQLLLLHLKNIYIYIYITK